MDSLDTFLKDISKLVNSNLILTDSNYVEIANSSNSEFNLEKMHKYDISSNNFLFTYPEIKSFQSIDLIKLMLSTQINSPNINKPLEELLFMDENLYKFGSHHQDLLNTFLNFDMLGVVYSGESILQIKSIIESTFSLKSFVINNQIIFFSNHDETDQLADGSIKNVQSEIFEEIKIFNLGKITNINSFHYSYLLYENMKELVSDFNIFDKYVKKENLFDYRIVNSIDSKLEEEILQKVFPKDVISNFDEELQMTINLFFKNNLNLTDTSKELYIHRNTLLYRIEKINKLTGFDLRKFEDSWIFRFAWLIYKRKK